MKTELSDGEWRLMKVLWSSGSMTIAQLTGALKEGTGWSTQTPVKPGASAPGFLSRLRRLLLPAGREKSSTRLLLAVTIFLFSRHA